ncbi:alpha/beta-hydrolase [Delitschia confertaspora ATCC 74209]|uniref:Alpha/beta-hydrolase n=1 Tax=Delitschia confertaspora ATCC 74209 TaxID=1513339 RepID=A0A9P4MYM7_9PLEO|nr:alpha/beta-hydrolase [Delitschia confertaspora ATCC 74209]
MSMQPPSELSNISPPIHTTHRNDRTLLTLIIQLLCRLFRPLLNRPTHTTATQIHGSPPLRPHKNILKACIVTSRLISTIYIYDIHPHINPPNAPETVKGPSEDPNAKPNSPTLNPKKRLYYIPGSSWQSPPSPHHWKLLASLSHSLYPSISVSLISAPLAPRNPAPVAFPMLMGMYRELLEEAHKSGESIILAGDSSGATLALGVVLETLRMDEEALRESRLAEESREDRSWGGIACAKEVILISPSVDLTRSNPSICSVAHLDPFLTPAVIQSTAETWYAGLDPVDPRISPLFADISLLRKAGVKIHGVIGGYDILTPDSRLFKEKCTEEGVVGKWLEWERQMHCFPLTGVYGVREGRESVRWIVDVLKG